VKAINFSFQRLWLLFRLKRKMPSRFRYSFICQGSSTRKQWRNLFGLRVELPPLTTCLTTRR